MVLDHHGVALLDQLFEQLPIDFAVSPEAEVRRAAVCGDEEAGVVGEDAGVERIDAHVDQRAAPLRLERGKRLVADVKGGMAPGDLLLGAGKREAELAETIEGGQS